MAKFELYSAGGTKPLLEYEGDYLEVHGDSVSVMLVNDGTGHSRAIAVIRLAEGQSVKKAK